MGIRNLSGSGSLALGLERTEELGLLVQRNLLLALQFLNPVLKVGNFRLVHFEWSGILNRRRARLLRRWGFLPAREPHDDDHQNSEA